MRVLTILCVFITWTIVSHAKVHKEQLEDLPELISLACFLETAPCSQEEQVYKDAILEIMETNCSECDDTLKTLIRELTWRLRQWFPLEYEKLLQKYHLEHK